MKTNLDKYKSDVADLVKLGNQMRLSINVEFYRKELLNAGYKEKDLKEASSVRQNYEKWYSEAKALIKQLLPDRLDDFCALYAPAKTRKEITYATYTISDYMRGLKVTRGIDTLVDGSAAVPLLDQQVAIVEALQKRFESSLYDIKLLLHSDLLDDEIQAARELNKKGFARAAGALAGVALEAHLSSVLRSHAISLKKKNASISDLNDQAKAEGIIDVAKWRFIQMLGDIRNKCDHKKADDPTIDEVSKLIDGVDEVTKTVF